jgi:hypothetical protein
MDAAGSIFGGYSQAQQYTTQAALASQQAKDVSLQATQTSEQRREQLNSSLSNIAANRAQANLSSDSPTAQAIQGAVTASGNRAEAMGRLGYLNQGQALNWQAAGYRRASSNAITGGYINGAVKMGQDAAKAMGA